MIIQKIEWFQGTTGTTTNEATILRIIYALYQGFKNYRTIYIEGCTFRGFTVLEEVKIGKMILLVLKNKHS